MIHYYRKEITAKGEATRLIDSPLMVITKESSEGEVLYREGHFMSPIYNLAKEFFNGNGNIARASWQGLFPKNGAKNGLVVLLAGTGDHTFFRRRWGFSRELLKLGISSILLENPFYGTRKPKDQFRSSLSNVSDLFIMGGCLIAECCLILRWAAENGYSPLGLSGVSMGGHMASLALTNVKDENTSLVNCLSWTSGAPVYTLGSLSTAIPWELLEKELDTSKSLNDAIKKCEWDRAMDSKPAIDLFPSSRTKRFMWALMTDFTDLSMYPVPRNPALVETIVAEEDSYVLRIKEIPDLASLWPGSTVKVIPGQGHVEAYFRCHHIFRGAIVEHFKKLTNNPEPFIATSLDPTPLSTRALEIRVN